MRDVARDPASLSLWTFYELADADRIQRLLTRAQRVDSAKVTAAAMWAPNELAKEEASVRSALRTHPDPDVERALRDAAVAKGRIIVERVIGGAK